MLYAPVKLSDCQSPFLMNDDPEHRYVIDIKPGDYLVLCVGAKANTPSARFTHPNIAATEKDIFEFKHYRRNGSKFWTRSAGINHYFIVPRSAVTLLPSSGYSYIDAEINGVKVKFNVSGGCGFSDTPNTWVDWLGTNVETSVGYPVKVLRKIAEASVRNSPLDPLTVKSFDPKRIQEWDILAAKSTPTIKDAIIQLIEEKKRPVIHFLKGYSYDGRTEAPAVETYRRMKKTNVVNNPEPGVLKRFSYGETGALKAIIMDFGFLKVRAKVAQIDWDKTAKANNIA